MGTNVLDPAVALVVPSFLFEVVKIWSGEIYLMRIDILLDDRLEITPYDLCEVLPTDRGDDGITVGDIILLELINFRLVHELLGTPNRMGSKQNIVRILLLLRGHEGNFQNLR